MPPQASEKQNYCNFCYSNFKACKCKATYVDEPTIEELEQEIQRLIRILEARQQRQRFLNTFRNIGQRFFDVNEFFVQHERLIFSIGLVMNLMNLIFLCIFFFVWTQTDAKETSLKKRLQTNIFMLLMNFAFAFAFLLRKRSL